MQYGLFNVMLLQKIMHFFDNIDYGSYTKMTFSLYYLY